jgi:tetratricopeptide (TPR) repeat protein
MGGLINGSQLRRTLRRIVREAVSEAVREITSDEADGRVLLEALLLESVGTEEPGPADLLDLPGALNPRIGRILNSLSGQGHSYDADRLVTAVALHVQRGITVDAARGGPMRQIAEYMQRERLISAVEQGVARQGIGYPAPQNPALNGSGHPSTPFAQPRQLPTAVTTFSGRRQELAQLQELVANRSLAVPVALITGDAGAGKTSLAIHWAHSAQGHFPDGQLYVDLGGYGPGGPVDASEALGQFLRAMGLPDGQVPAARAEQAALYRSLLAGRRVLVLLDNAATPEQVVDLIPGSAGCAAIVTSRSYLISADPRFGVSVRIDLGALTLDEALELLWRAIPDERVGQDPASAVALAEWCYFLPIVLRIAADQVAVRRHETLATLVRELGAQSHLDALSSSARSAARLRTILSWSFSGLPPRAASLFLLLGLHPGPSVSVGAAAAIASESLTDVGHQLRLLADVHLIDEISVGRYRLHDLLYAYAAERAEAETDESTKTAAVRRCLEWYQYAADAADRVTAPRSMHARLDEHQAYALPGFQDRKETLTWCDAERANLVAASHQAARHGLDQIAWNLAYSLTSYLEVRCCYEDLAAVSTIALQSAIRLGNQRLQASAFNHLGVACRELGKLGDALTYHQQARTLHHQVGDLSREATSINNMGIEYREMRRFDDAVACHRIAQNTYQQLGDQFREANALNNLAFAHLQAGQQDEARKCLVWSRDLYRAIGDPWGEATVLNNLASIAEQRRRYNGPPYDEARGQLVTAIILYRQAGDELREATTLGNLGGLHRDAGQLEDAWECWESAWLLFRQARDFRNADRVTGFLARDAENRRYRNFTPYSAELEEELHRFHLDRSQSTYRWGRARLLRPGTAPEDAGTSWEWHWGMGPGGQ